MATTDKRLCSGTLDDESATLYTVPAATTTIVKAITLCNKTANEARVTIKFDGIEVFASHMIAGYDSITIPFLDQILEAGELIAGHASAVDSINYYISGKEIA